MADREQSGDPQPGSPKLGKLAPPYPVDHCANVDCPTGSLSDGAYLYRDLESDKLVIFCEDCASYAELNASDRFKLVML